MPALKATRQSKSKLRTAGSTTATGRVRIMPTPPTRYESHWKMDVVEHRELAVDRHVREVQVRAELVLGDRHGETRRATHAEVQVRLALEALVPEEVRADREHVGDPVVEADRERRVRHVRVVDREGERRRELEATVAQHVHALHGVDLFGDLGLALDAAFDLLLGSARPRR